MIIPTNYILAVHNNKYMYIIYADAAKKYHEYLVQQEKPISEEQKVLLAKNNRITQRRQRVCIHTCVHL